jgi:hypothetical protein
MKIIPIIILALSSSVAFSQDKLISQITSTYNSNQARFHTQYKGLQFNGSGNVQKIEADFLGTGKEFMVTLNSNGSNLVCSTKDKNAASKLDKGEQIKFTGIIHDVLFGNLLLNNCSFDKITVQSKLDVNKDFANSITTPCPKLIDSRLFKSNNYFYSKDHQLLVQYESSPTSGTISWINFNNLEVGFSHRNIYKETTFDGKHHREKWSDKFSFSIDEEGSRCLFSNNFTFSDESGKTTCGISGKVFACKWSNDASRR